MAGLEVNLSSLKEAKKGVTLLTILNSIIPFFIGFVIGYYFGGNIMTALFMGIIFISTSIAVVVPSLEKNNLFSSKIGQTIVASTMIEDILSLVFLSVILQNVDPITPISLPLFYAVLAILIIGTRLLMPILHSRYLNKKFFLLKKTKEAFFQRNLRVVFAMLISVVILFEILGLHPIIAAFFAGLVLSEVIHNEQLIEKLHIISYGIFIPIFFVITGASVDIRILGNVSTTLPIVIAVLIGSMGSKFISGWIGSKISGFSTTESSLIGSATIPQLSTTLAVVFVGFEFGLLNETMVTAMVILSIVTVIIGPLLINFFARKMGIVKPRKLSDSLANIIK